MVLKHIIYWELVLRYELREHISLLRNKYLLFLIDIIRTLLNIVKITVLSTIFKVINWIKNQYFNNQFKLKILIFLNH